MERWRRGIRENDLTSLHSHISCARLKLRLVLSGGTGGLAGAAQLLDKSDKNGYIEPKQVLKSTKQTVRPRPLLLRDRLYRWKVEGAAGFFRGSGVLKSS